MFGMPRVIIRGRPSRQGERESNEELQEENAGQGNPLMNFFSSFFGANQNNSTHPGSGATPPGQGTGVTFTFTAGSNGRSAFRRTDNTPSPLNSQQPVDPNADPPDAEAQERAGAAVPIRSLSDYLSNAFGGPPNQPSTPTAETTQQNSPSDLGSALFSMLGGMASGGRGGQNSPGVAGRTMQGPGGVRFFFSAGGGENGGNGLGFPGLGDFVFNESTLDNVISMLMAQVS